MTKFHNWTRTEERGERTKPPVCVLHITADGEMIPVDFDVNFHDHVALLHRKDRTDKYDLMIAWDDEEPENHSRFLGHWNRD